MKVIRSINSLKGEIVIPGDKSISHRAIMLSSLAKGESEIEGFLPGADCLSTIECFRKLGVTIHYDGGSKVKVQGNGLNGLKEPSEVLDAGNSGTTARLIMGILAGQKFFSCITGDASLNNRPMGRIVKPLSKMGATFLGRDDNNKLPLGVVGTKLHDLEYEMDVASAQLKSAILLAGLYAENGVVIKEHDKSRDHTERMLEAFGAKIEYGNGTICLESNPELQAIDITVPGDISSAAFFIVAALIVPDSELLIRNVGINPTRSGCLQVLMDMGGRIELLNERLAGKEPVADIRVRSSELKGVEIKGDIIPTLIDEIPILTVAAMYATGTTRITDAQELRVKESDRISVVATEFKKLGADIRELPDGLEINPKKEYYGTACHSYHDHRIAMSLAIAGLRAKEETTIHDADCVNISYPNFWEEIELLIDKKVT